MKFPRDRSGEFFVVISIGGKENGREIECGEQTFGVHFALKQSGDLV